MARLPWLKQYKQATIFGLLLTTLGDGGRVAKCCQQSTDDRRLLITFSVQLCVQLDSRFGVTRCVARVRLRQLKLVD